MTRALAAELLKQRTTRLPWGLLLGAVLFTMLGVALTAVFSGTEGTPGLDEDGTVANVWAQAGGGYVFALVAGIVLITGEYRHQTITSAYLGEPRRWRVVAAKLITALLLGVVYGVAACATAAAVAVPVLAARGATGQADVPAILLGAVAATALWAVVGLGVGALLRNQVAALIGALVWVLVVEALVVALLPDVGRWLPSGAANALLQASLPTGGDLLPVWAGGALLLGYGLALAVAGSLTTVRRDVT